MMTEVLWIAGAGIVLGFLAQGGYLTWDLFRRGRHQEEQRQRAAEVLAARLQAALVHHRAEERKALAWAGWRKFEVRKKSLEDPGKSICSFHLSPHDGKPIPSFLPGQFLTFQLRIPGQQKPTVRCYSLSDCSRDDHYRVSIKRVLPPRGSDAPPGLSSNFFHDRVREGDILDVKAPSGVFSLDLADPSPVVLIGGGVGLTPVLSMLNAIVEAGDTRETWFFYGVRNGSEHAMKEHLETVARENPNVRLQICYSDPAATDAKDRDYHHAERVSVELFKRVLPSSNYGFYICGPPPMMDAIVADLEGWGVPKEKIHFEKFGPGAPKKKPAVSPDAQAGPSFEVTFKRAGKKALWTSAAGTLLDLARANGVAVDSGCERGDCGTCQTAVRSGEVDYSEKPAFEYQAGTCLVCCCVPKGAVELDV